MEYSPEHDTPDWKALFGWLQRGRESAIRLQKPSAGRGSGSSDDNLIADIMRSFSESISILKGGARRVSPVDRSSKGSDQSKKRLGVKDRRGCYRRRNSEESRVFDSPTAEDQHAWRKYGQKDILNTNFPRCYFRCTHRTDQNCKATKQVQKINDDPPRYRITYFGHHTCQNTLMTTPQIISEPEPMDQYSYLLNFETKTMSRNAPPPPPPISSTVNQEFKEETLSNVTECLDSSMWHDMGETSGIQKLDTANSNTTTKTGSSYNDQEAVSSFHPSGGPSTPLQNPFQMEAFGTNFDDYGLYMEAMAFNNIGQFHN